MTSSHGLRYLSQCFEEVFEPSFKYACPEVDAESNRKLTGDVVDEMVAFAKRREPENQLHLMGLGDNNLRRLKEDPKEFLRLVEALVVGMSEIRNCHLVLIGLLPSKESNDFCKHVFIEVNETFKRFANEKYWPENVSYLNIAKGFLFRGRVDKSLYRDGVHMNAKGSSVYAKMIRNHLKKLPNRYFQ